MRKKNGQQNKSNICDLDRKTKILYYESCVADTSFSTILLKLRINLAVCE